MMSCHEDISRLRNHRHDEMTAAKTIDSVIHTAPTKSPHCDTKCHCCQGSCQQSLVSGEISFLVSQSLGVSGTDWYLWGIDHRPERVRAL